MRSDGCNLYLSSDAASRSFGLFEQSSCTFTFGGNAGCLIVLICNYSCIVFIPLVCVWVTIYNGLDI